MACDEDLKVIPKIAIKYPWTTYCVSFPSLISIELGKF